MPSRRRSILRLIYPLFVFYKKLGGGKGILHNREITLPNISFYSLAVRLSDGTELKFSELRGRKVLLVNTASDCGYTHQYQELQQLYDKCKTPLQIIAFPSNDFKAQERGTNEEIADFCSRQYQITFPVAAKSGVRASTGQNEVYRWLSNKEMNGWNRQGPSWNFSKYLVNEEGILTDYFEPFISPLSRPVMRALNS